jgi:hypothetical protein
MKSAAPRIPVVSMPSQRGWAISALLCYHAFVHYRTFGYIEIVAERGRFFQRMAGLSMKGLIFHQPLFLTCCLLMPMDEKFGLVYRGTLP